jgi:hypothetical protein
MPCARVLEHLVTRYACCDGGKKVEEKTKYLKGNNHSDCRLACLIIVSKLFKYTHVRYMNVRLNISSRRVQSKEGTVCVYSYLHARRSHGSLRSV